MIYLTNAKQRQALTHLIMDAENADFGEWAPEIETQRFNIKNDLIDSWFCLVDGQHGILNFIEDIYAYLSEIQITEAYLDKATSSLTFKFGMGTPDEVDATVELCFPMNDYAFEKFKEVFTIEILRAPASIEDINKLNYSTSTGKFKLIHI